MRKRILDATSAPERRAATDGPWLAIDLLALAEVTSEDPAHPVEGALVAGAGSGTGWRAGAAGPQTLRIRFDAPQRLRRILLEIEEKDVARTQEVVVAWVDGSGVRREVVRQQWNFSTSGSTLEVEEWAVDLADVVALEVTIDPDMGRAQAVAAIRKLRMAAT